MFVQSSDTEKREMIFGVYGNFGLILKDLQSTKTVSLKEFMALKPQLANGILDRAEPIIQKLIEKG